MSYSGEGTSLGGTTGVGGAVNKDATDGKPVVDEAEKAAFLKRLDAAGWERLLFPSRF